MSFYENYDKVGKLYDDFRYPAGLDILRAAIPDDASTARVLDAGTGTGNYALGLAPHVRHVTALDANEAMLDRLRHKLTLESEETGEKFDVVQASLTKIPLPFQDDSFDFVLCNMVAHHLDAEPPYPNLRRLIKEFRRLLRPGGVVVMGTTTAPTFYPHWLKPYVEGNPAIQSALPNLQWADGPQLQLFCQESSFANVRISTTPQHFHGVHYCNFASIFDDRFRSANSSFRHFPPGAVDQLMRDVAKDMHEGKLVDRIQATEEFRRERGACAFVIGK